MLPYIHKSKAFVFPSKWYEGSPLTVVEMLSFGLPCIVSDASSATEIVDDGNNGIVFGTDVERLSSVLSENLPNDNGFDSSHWSVNCHVAKLVDLFGGLDL